MMTMQIKKGANEHPAESNSDPVVPALLRSQWIPANTYPMEVTYARLR
jgi:hypothetical protein